MNKLNFYPHSGHCYPDLLEKENGKVIAKMRALIWKSDFERINKKFIDTIQEPLKDGIHILFLARIQYDGNYGLSLLISDIDINFSLGELQKEKLETIKKLKAEGVFDHNRNLKLPLAPQRIAIISVETSKGYGDLKNVLAKNQYGFKFYHRLFPAILQGERAVVSIRFQLNQVLKHSNLFDIVLIVRGGGDEVGLSAFNNYELAKDIAQFPIPVFTGIGHATNESVADLVAFKNGITPTNIGDLLIQLLYDFQKKIMTLERKIILHYEKKFGEEKNKFQKSVKHLKSLIEWKISDQKHFLNQVGNSLNNSTQIILKEERNKHVNAVIHLGQFSKFLMTRHHQDLENSKIDLNKDVRNFIVRERTKMDNLKQKLTVLDPVNVLKRGFSITRFHGKIIQDSNDIAINEEIETQLFNGTINSKITSKK